MLRVEPLILNSDSCVLYDRFVPATHPLRQFDECLNFSFILPLVAERYHDEIGRPAEHPEQMHRLLFAQFYLNLSGRTSIATQRYTAYGSRWAVKSSGTLPTDRGFTGQIRDGSRSNFDFYFYRSRYYNSSIGKFVQPDSVVPDPKNPQALNRYAYGLNNPLKFVDPSGHDSTSDDRDKDLSQINSQDWSVRLHWLREFVKLHQLGNWFNDIEGAISYFAHSPNLQHNAALLDADAKVLTAVRDGWAGYRNGDAGHDRAAAAWATFFGDYTAELRIPEPTKQEVFRLKQLRYNAEQAGVDWAVNQGLSATYGRDESGFVAAGFVWGANGYRWLGGNSALGAILPGGVSVADPRNPPPEYALVAQAGEFAIGYTWGLYTRPTLISLLGGE